VTALGDLRVVRVRLECPCCDRAGYLADGRLGLDGHLSAQARRLICLVGTRGGYEAAAAELEQLCGWTVSDETIRTTCMAQAQEVATWLAEAPDLPVAFRAAAGALEIQVDATKVNTTGGWRDLKIGIFARRPKGKAATAAEWAARVLPAPTARLAFAAIEGCDTFGERLGGWARRLWLRDPRRATVLGDGAEWIWEQAATWLPGATGVLDIFHASEHLGAAARAIHGEGTEAARAWLDSTREALLERGWEGLREVVDAAREQAGDDVAVRSTLEETRGYFAKNKARLGYAERLTSGRSIGSGMVEGACKTGYGRRLKQTRARWLVTNVQKMAVLCSLRYSGGWEEYWRSAA